MKQQVDVLLLEDNEMDAQLIDAILRAEGLKLNIRRVESEMEFETALKTWKADLIISDYSLPSYDGLAALSAAKTLSPGTPFLFYSGTIGEESAIEALHQGATDYILKQRPKRLVSAVRRALDELEQKERQHAAEQQILAQAQLLDLASDAILVQNIGDWVLFWNHGAEGLYGYTKAEAAERSLPELVYRVPAKDFEKAKQKTLQLGEWQGELEQRTKDNRLLRVNSRWTLVRNSRNEPDRILTINTDITERKKLEAQFLRAQRLESVGTLASGIAHDLNNILAPILMGTDILRGQKLDPDALSMVELIQRSAQRGADVVKQVLTFVRGTDGKPIHLHLDHLIKDVCNVARETFPKNIRVECVLAQDLWPIKGDVTQLHQVLMNLCINARDAMPNGGILKISAQNSREDSSAELNVFPKGASVLLAVQDSGCGISPEDIDKIFDPFFTTKEPGKGTGLGLSTVLGIVQAHGGSVKVESDRGTGSCFRVYIPADLISDTTQLFNVSSAAPRGHGELILVVDDEPNIRQLALQVLTAHGYEVITAADGSTGVVRFAEKKDAIALVLTDVMMPGVDGSSLAKSIKAMKPSVRLIATSGLSEQQAVPEASHFVKKPYSAEELLRTIDKALHSSS